jgi:hypothetical protein
MANNALIGAVRAEATLESGKFVSGAKKIRQEAKATETQLKRSFGAMGAAAKGFGGALTAGLSIGLLAGLGKKVLDYAGSIGEVAQQLGVTTNELQTFRFAAQQNGATVEQADKALGRFAISISKAQSGSTAAIKAFNAVGVSLTDLKTKSRTDLIGQVADQMKATGGAAANAASGVALFGRDFLKIVPTLDQGSKGLNELSAAAEKLGIVLSDQQIQQADETADKLEAVKTVLAAQIAGVVTANASSIVTLAQSLATLTSSIVNFLGSNPQAALGILGALAGSRFGVAGAAAGGIGGLFLGGRMDAQARSASTDARVRSQELAKAKAELDRVSKLYGGQGTNKKQIDTAKAEVRRQIGLARQVASQNRARAGELRNPKTAAVDLPQFLAPTGGGGKTRTPKAPRDRSDDVTFQFDQELRRAQIDVLRAQQGMARTSEERAEIALKLLDAERGMQEAELNDRVRRAERDYAEGKITAGALEQAKAQADKLRAEYASVEAMERQAIADDLAADKARESAELRDSSYELQLELLQLDASLADTAQERRAAELRILELAKQQEKARLEAVIADQQSSELAKQQAQQRLGELDNIYAGRAAVVRQSTRGPMESMQAEFGDLSEEMEQLKVQGIMGAVDALGQFTNGWDAMRDAAVSAIQQVLQELIRLQLMKMAMSFIGGGGPSGASIMSTYAGNTAAISGMLGPIPGMSTGGGFNIKGARGFDKNTLSLNGLPIANVSYGERVSVSNDNDGGMGGMGGIHIGAIHLPPGMTPSEGRKTALSFGRGLQESMGYTIMGRKR